MRMPSHTLPRPLRLLGIAVMLGAGVSAHAKPGDTLQPYLLYNVTQDDNLFLLPTNESSDIYQQFGAGMQLDWKQSQQEVTGHLSANDTTFSKNSILDYSGYDMLGQWNWQRGKQLLGQLGFTANRTLGTFLDTGNIDTQNTVDSSTKFFTGSYLIHPRWRINAALDTASYLYSATTLNYNNRVINHAQISTDYLTPRGSTLGIYAERWAGSYTNNQIICILYTCGYVDNSYTENDIGVRGTWALDGKVQLNSTVAQTWRYYNQYTQRNFTGLTGTLGASWQATDKLQVNGSVYRNIGALLDTYASYSINDGVNLSPAWMITQKIKLSATAFAERRSYLGDPFALGIFRDDRATGYSLTLNYQPREWASLSAIYQGQNRNSNFSVFNFSDQSLSLSAQLIF